MEIWIWKLYIWKICAYANEPLGPWLLPWPVWAMNVGTNPLRFRSKTFKISEIINFSQFGLTEKHISRLDTKIFLVLKEVWHIGSLKSRTWRRCFISHRAKSWYIHVSFFDLQKEHVFIFKTKCLHFHCTIDRVLSSMELDKGLFQISSDYL